MATAFWVWEPLSILRCAEHRRGQAADTETSPLPSPPVPRVCATGQSEAEPSQGTQREHMQTGLGGDIKTFFGTNRIPEYVVLPKKPLRAAELKTNLRTGHSREWGLGNCSTSPGELLYQPSPHSAMLHIYIYSFSFRYNKNIAFKIHSSDRQTDRFPLKRWQ